MIYSEGQNGEFPFGFQGFGKNRGVGWLQADNKMKKIKKNKKKNSLKQWATGLRS